MKKVFSNRVAALIVVVLCILPSLYAWFYLKSSWDPYGNTRGLKVAVVNNDLGTDFRDSFVNIGAEVLEELKTNQDIGWVFVPEELALEGTRLGKYYANIVIESGFSEKMVTLLDEFPQHPEIRYTVNEKINAIAPKITDKGASTIKDNIQKSFVDTVNRVLMERLNLVGFDVKKDKGKIQDFVNFVQDARKDVDGWGNKLDRAITSTERARNELQRFESKIPGFYEDIDQGREVLNTSISLSKDTLDLLDSAPSQLRSIFDDMDAIMQDVDSELVRFLNRADNKSQDFDREIAPVLSGLSSLDKKIGLELQFLTPLRTVIADFLPQAKILKPLDAVIAKLTAFRSKINHFSSSLRSLSSGMRRGIDFGKDTRKSVKNVSDDLQSTLKNIRSDIDSEITPQLRSVLEQVRELSEKGVKSLNDAERRIPDLQRDVNSGVNLFNSGLEKLQEFKTDLPKFQANIRTLDQRLQDLKRRGILDDFIKIATLDPNRFSAFISDPIELVENKLFSIPNYGSAMSPFFTTLAIRVGPLLSISLFTTRIRRSRFFACKNYQKFFGKRLFFLTIALVQALIVSLGDLFLLKAYVAHPFPFIGVALLTAFVFSMIIYTTVATFGNGGKALVILFLVLQLSGAGGTFPVELSGPFFQAINPFLPFTYAIASMRETVGGIVPQIFIPNLLLLFGFFGCFLLIGLFLKPRIARRVARFEQKFSQSELGEH